MSEYLDTAYPLDGVKYTDMRGTCSDIHKYPFKHKMGLPAIWFDGETVGVLEQYLLDNWAGYVVLTRHPGGAGSVELRYIHRSGSPGGNLFVGFGGHYNRSLVNAVSHVQKYNKERCQKG